LNAVGFCRMGTEEFRRTSAPIGLHHPIGRISVSLPGYRYRHTDTNHCSSGVLFKIRDNPKKELKSFHPQGGQRSI
jgi:hypothetical protein